ncbi:MAG: tetratricopeptide repeat protein [Pyrinomonadaceae bacterium]
MFNKTKYFLIAIILMTAVTLQTAEAQTEPLSFSEIITVLNTKNSSKDPKNKTEAIDILTKEIKTRKIRSPLTNDIKKLLIESGATPAFLETVKASFRPDPGSGTAESYFESGNEFFKKKDYDRAIIEYSKALILDPTMARAQANRGKAHYENNDIWDAYYDYSEAIMCPIDLETEELIDLLFRRASLQNDNSLQNDDLTEIIRLDRNNIKAYEERGFNSMLDGNYKSARADYDMVVKIAPENVNSYISRAEFFYKSDEWKDAIADWRKTLEIDPDNKIAKNNLSNRLKSEEEGLNDIFSEETSAKKLSLFAISKALRHDVFLFPEAKKKEILLSNIKNRGLDFTLTGETEQELRKIGADDEIIQAIRKAK